MIENIQPTNSFTVEIKTILDKVWNSTATLKFFCLSTLIFLFIASLSDFMERGSVNLSRNPGYCRLTKYCNLLSGG